MIIVSFLKVFLRFETTAVVGTPVASCPGDSEGFGIRGSRQTCNRLTLPVLTANCAPLRHWEVTVFAPAL